MSSKPLASPRVQTIVVEHRDRLLHFGAEYVEAALAAQGRKLMVVESSDVNLGSTAALGTIEFERGLEQDA